MKNKLNYLFIFLAALAVVGATIYFIYREDIFPQGLIINKATLIKLPLKLNGQETIAVFRELDGKEIKMESFFDKGLDWHCNVPAVAEPWDELIKRKLKNIIRPNTSLIIYPTNNKLYTEGGYQLRPPELNSCMGKILLFKIQTPYDPVKDVYYLVVKQKNKVKLRIKLPPAELEPIQLPKYDLMD